MEVRRTTAPGDASDSGVRILVGFALVLLVLLAIVFLTYGSGEPGVRQAVRWTARTSLLCLCAALFGEGLRGSFFGWTRRAELLRSLALSHAVHACFVAALAVLEGGRNLVQRSSPVDVLGGALAYVFIFWGALRPSSRLTSVGLFWIAGVFMVSYGTRALRAPLPFAFPLALLVAALAVRVGGSLVPARSRTADAVTAP